MALQQPLVFRLFFSSEESALEAQGQLTNLKVLSDRIKTDKDEYKVIFTAENLTLGEKALLKLRARPRLAQVFDPQVDWAEGFKPVTTTEQVKTIR